MTNRTHRFSLFYPSGVAKLPRPQMCLPNIQMTATRTTLFPPIAARSFAPAFLSAGFVLLLLILSPAGCQKPQPTQWQGYVEGEFVYVASPLAGQLQTLSVQRGQQVQTNDPLFTLDSTPEKAARDEAQRRVQQSLANLEDLKKGKRPTEIDSMEAQLKQAQAAANYSATEFARDQQLVASGGVSALELDKARSARDQDIQHVAQLQADLATMRLGSRDDQIAAAEKDVQALQASLASAEWNLAQKQQSAPQAGVVFDTLYRQGEWVDAGHPVVALLPPPNIKIHASSPRPKSANSIMATR